MKCISCGSSSYTEFSLGGEGVEIGHHECDECGKDYDPDVFAELERLQADNEKLTTEATKAARILSALLEADVHGMGPISKAIVMASVCRIIELTEAAEEAKGDA